MRINRKLTKQGKFFDPVSIGLAISAIGLIGGAAGTAVQFVQNEKISKASEKAEELRRKQQELEASRARRSEIRKSLVARAGIVNSAATQGTLGSSGQVGAAGSVQSQAGFNITQINQSEEIGNQLFDTNKDISKARGRSATGASIANFGFSAAANSEKAGRVGAQLFKL